MFFITLSRRQIWRRTVYLFGLVLLIAFTSWAGSGAHFAWVPGADQPLTRADSPDNRLALTFNITWGDKELNNIRGVLAAGGVKATFFVGGTFLGNNPNAIRQLAADGHEIGTLGQKIIDLSALPENEVTSNLLASQSALSKMLGGPVRYFRPPQGPATPGVVTAARAANLITVTSSLDSKDHEGLRADQIAQRILKSAQKGDIILLSASDWAAETTKALPAIIKGLQDRGFKLVRVSELVPQEDLH